ERLVYWSSYKGFAFVIITAVLLLFLLRHAFGVIGAAYESLCASEQAFRNEREFNHTMIESMPGILYFYDSAGRFLRWNKNFETLSGFSGEEVKRMHPRDFFSGSDQTEVEQRISEVFANGGSSVEASLKSKSGA